MSKYNVRLKTLLLQGFSEPEFYGDLVYKFRKIIGKNGFPYAFKKIIICNKKIGYNIDVLRQTACLVILESVSEVFQPTVDDVLYFILRNGEPALSCLLYPIFVQFYFLQYFEL